MPLAYPLINGVRFDFSSAEINIAGLILNGVKGVTYKHTLDPGLLRGNRAQVIGRTRGKYDAEGSVELYLAEYQTLISVLAAQANALGMGYLEQSFDINVSYSEFGQEVVTDELHGCRIKSPDKSFQEGNDALSVKCDLHVMYILESRLSPLGIKQLLK